MTRFLILTGLVLLGFSACKTSSQVFSKHAERFNFQEVQIAGDQFQHLIYTNSAALKAHKNLATLHVYLDGDGSPWIRHRWISGDPTSKNPLILNLMHLDSGPAILLGRPCYHGLNENQDCLPKFWTSHRYSEAVVVSMVQALNHWIEKYPVKELVLIGHSGGGVLAMLIAPYIKSVHTVVTIAANLDVAAWTELHGYQPLSGSLNPAVDSNSLGVRQIHIAGGQDSNVPPLLIETFAKQQTEAQYYLYEQHNHVCCWESHWKEILNMF